MSDSGSLFEKETEEPIQWEVNTRGNLEARVIKMQIIVSVLSI